MVTYTVETVTVILNLIRPIQGRPTFRGLWHLSQALSECLGKLGHPIHPEFGFAGYMMTPEAYALYSQTEWRNPPDVGEYFQVPTTAITETEQKSEENRWKANKNLRDNFKNIRTALVLLFERIIDEAYHSGGTQVAGLGRRGFGNDEPPDIIERLKRLYGKPSLQELDQALLRLNDPMDRNLPVEVMLRSVEEIQMFLMAHPDGDRQMSDVNLISYGTIKLSKCGGLYTKAMERWQAKNDAVKRVWANFRQHYITEYEKLLAEGGGTTLGQDGYGGAFNATAETITDDTSLTESIVRYAERASAAEGKVSELEQRLSQLEVGSQMMAPPPHAAYFAPEMAYFTPQQQVPPTINIPPPQQQYGVQQQYGGQNSFQQPYQPNKRSRKRGGSAAGDQGQYFGARPTGYQQPPQPYNPYQQQTGGGNYGRGGGYGNGNGRGNQRGRGRRGGRGGRGENKGPSHTNVLKRFDNLHYCYTCGYDVDHPGTQCNHTNGGFHMPNIKRNEAHLYATQGASMVAQHKSLATGEGCGMGWIMANSVSKAQFVMERQQQFRQQHAPQGGNHNNWQSAGGQQNNWQGAHNAQQNWGQNNWQPGHM
jgi:hypothetical protein